MMEGGIDVAMFACMESNLEVLACMCFAVNSFHHFRSLLHVKTGLYMFNIQSSTLLHVYSMRGRPQGTIE